MYLDGVDRVSKAYQLVTGGRGNKYTARARSPNTWLVCGVAVRSLKGFCEVKGYVPLPAPLEVLEEWIVHLAENGLRISTIRTYLGGISTWHRRHGYEIRTKMLLDTLKGIAKESPPPQKSKPLMAAQLHEILDHLDASRVIEVRSGGLLSLMLSCSMRAPEACALDWMRLGDHRDDDINAGYLLVRDRGLEVVLTRSKTSPTQAVTLPVPSLRMPRTVEWVQRWAALASLEPGKPAFRAIRKGGRITANRLAPASVTPIVRHHVQQQLIRAGMDADKALVASLDYSSHACRSGFLSTGAAAGTEEWRLRERSRHKSPTVAAGYIQLQSGWDAKWGFEL